MALRHGPRAAAAAAAAVVVVVDPTIVETADRCHVSQPADFEVERQRRPLEEWRRASTSTVEDVRRLAGRPRAFGDASTGMLRVAGCFDPDDGGPVRPPVSERR